MCLYLLTSFKQVYAAQMTKTSHAVTSVQTAQAKNAKTTGELAARLSTAEAQLVLLAPYSTVCSTDLEGPNGPTRFYFACSTRPPAGS